MAKFGTFPDHSEPPADHELDRGDEAGAGSMSGWMRSVWRRRAAAERKVMLQPGAPQRWKGLARQPGPATGTCRLGRAMGPQGDCGSEYRCTQALQLYAFVVSVWLLASGCMILPQAWQKW